MTPADAWRYVAERAQSSVKSDDEQLVLCDVLLCLARELRLPDEQAATGKLRAALLSRDEAQMEFSELIASGLP